MIKESKAKIIFEKKLFSNKTMKKYISKKTYRKYVNLLENGGEMDVALAKSIAEGMKTWAIDNGATHYTHWFSPLTGKNAEKQVTFLDKNSHGKIVEKLSADSLIKGETDASSFPNGGERMSFEARGYTVWDYSSPVFIKQDTKGNKTLYIPTAFCGFNGVALDEKTPLLRALDCLDFYATKVLNKLGHEDVKHVICQVGSEQEYFLIKKSEFLKRKDLCLTGRTLLGSKSTKSQELYHHYMGELDDEISKFMNDVNVRLWELGIMAKLQHNEAAPAQHELVPVYSSANIACDQNKIIMGMLNKVADEHDFACLLHEKPFNGINGSGKHNNWSLSTNTGKNLLDLNKVGKDIFLLFFTTIIAAIDKHYDLVRMSTAGASNDLRLGGNEAPPSIISVYIGRDMLELLECEVSGKHSKKKVAEILNVNAAALPKLFKDSCDRNRTSPFAFTDNKFEFRMVGSQTSNAFVNTILCSIVANELKDVLRKLESAKNTDTLFKEIIKENINKHSRIIFNGNSYDIAWHKEGERRGLINYINTVECCNVLNKKENIKLFDDIGIFSETEINLRRETMLKTYSEEILLEAQTLCEIINKQVLPNINFMLCEILNSKTVIFNATNENSKFLEDMAKKFTEGNSKLYEFACEIVNSVNELSDYDIELKAEKCRELLFKMQEAREVYDMLEPHIWDKYKPFPTYDDLLLK